MSLRVFEKNGCPTIGVLREFSLGALSDESFETIAEHLQECTRCEDCIATIDFGIEFLGDAEDAARYENEPDYLNAREFIARIPDRIAEPLPDTIAGYEVRECLGRGGMGIVYKVWDSALERHVVVKLIRSARVASESAIEQFKKELQAIGNLKHPAIVQAHHGGFLPDGQPYLVMEYLEGETLYELVKRNGPLEEKRACEILRDVASGIKTMHANGLIHRDVKPANVMILADGAAKVLDLGLAQKTTKADATAAGGVRGSLRYMAPEQAAGQDVDAKTDVYGLGATLFFALTGQPSLDVDSSLSKPEMLTAVREQPRRPITSLAGVSRGLADVVDRSQSIRPEERPSVEDFDKSAGHVSRLKIWMVVGVVTALVLTLSIWTTWKGPKEPTVESRNQSYRGVFTDDFMNGTGDQWERHLTTSAETEAFWEVENREFHIYTKDTVEMAALVATRRDIDVENLIDGRFTLKVSLDNLHTAAGCQFRWDPEKHDGYGVAIGVAHDGERSVALWKYDHWSMTALGTTTFMFEPNKRIVIRVEFYGPEISVKIWNEYTDAPSTPQIQVRDSTYPSGKLGLLVGTNIAAEPGSGSIGARFDDVYFEVPELPTETDADSSQSD